MTKVNKIGATSQRLGGDVDDRDPSCALVLKTLRTWGIKPKKMAVRTLNKGMITVRRLNKGIRQAWMQHKSFVDAKPRNLLGAVELKNTRTDDIFWVDMQNKGPYMREPKDWAEGGAHGAMKTVTGIDPYNRISRYILLDAPNQTERGAFISNEIAAMLLPFKSVIKGRYIDECTYIARDGGRTIYQCARARKKIPVGAFHLACDELRRMHKKNIFLRDIKPENMVLHKQEAKHIDVDLVYRPDRRDLQAGYHTPGYITWKLLNARNLGNPCDAMRRSDNYAMLKTMMYAALVSPAALGLPASLTLGRNPDGMVVNNTIAEWVRRYVRPNFQDEICLFLEEPATAVVRDLYEIFDW